MDPLPYGAALPLEERFWDDLFAQAKRWGLYTYEQARRYTYIDNRATEWKGGMPLSFLSQMASIHPHDMTNNPVSSGLTNSHAYD